MNILGILDENTEETYYALDVFRTERSSHNPACSWEPGSSPEDCLFGVDTETFDRLFINGVATMLSYLSFFLFCNLSNYFCHGYL